VELPLLKQRMEWDKNGRPLALRPPDSAKSGPLKPLTCNVGTATHMYRRQNVVQSSACNSATSSIPGVRTLGQYQNWPFGLP